MQSIIYFDCYSGASGDMLLGSILDKCIDFNWFCSELAKLNLPQGSYNIEKSYVDRSSISSCKINITLNKHEHHHRSYSNICNIIDNSDIDNNAKLLSKKIFYTLGVAEAKVHNTSLENIHFHEVGAIDSIIDIIGFCICISKLKPDLCHVSPLPVGKGSTCSAHGCLPVPAPATVEILNAHKTPVKNNPNIEGECLTPTAAAILCTIANEYSSFPDFDQITSIGYGAGDKIFNSMVTSNLRLITGIKKVQTDKLQTQIYIEAFSNNAITEKLIKELIVYNEIEVSTTKSLYPNKEK